MKETKTSLKEGITIFVLQLVALAGTLGGIGLLIRVPFSINFEEKLMEQQPAVAMALLGTFLIVIGIASERKVKRMGK